MYVLFLDIEGVLCDPNPSEVSGFGAMRKECVEAFNSVIEAHPDLGVILTSPWRNMVITKSMTMEGMHRLLCTHGVDKRMRLFGRTCEDAQLKNRGDQVLAYLKSLSSCQGFVVLDDDREVDFAGVKDYVYLTNPDVGLTREDAKEVSLRFTRMKQRDQMVEFLKSLILTQDWVQAVMDKAKEFLPGPDLQKQADELTAKHPVGTRVRYWKDSKRDGTLFETFVRAPFSVLEGHTVVGWLEGKPGCFSVEHLEFLPPEPLPRGKLIQLSPYGDIKDQEVLKFWAERLTKLFPVGTIVYRSETFPPVNLALIESEFTANLEKCDIEVTTARHTKKETHSAALLWCFQGCIPGVGSRISFSPGDPEQATRQAALLCQKYAAGDPVISWEYDGKGCLAELADPPFVAESAVASGLAARLFFGDHVVRKPAYNVVVLRKPRDEEKETPKEEPVSANPIRQTTGVEFHGMRQIFPANFPLVSHSLLSQIVDAYTAKFPAGSSLWVRPGETAVMLEKQGVQGSFEVSCKNLNELSLKMGSLNQTLNGSSLWVEADRFTSLYGESLKAMTDKGVNLDLLYRDGDHLLYWVNGEGQCEAGILAPNPFAKVASKGIIRIIVSSGEAISNVCIRKVVMLTKPRDFEPPSAPAGPQAAVTVCKPGLTVTPTVEFKPENPPEPESIRNTPGAYQRPVASNLEGFTVQALNQKYPVGSVLSLRVNMHPDWEPSYIAVILMSEFHIKPDSSLVFAKVQTPSGFHFSVPASSLSPDRMFD